MGVQQAARKLVNHADTPRSQGCAKTIKHQAVKFGAARTETSELWILTCVTHGPDHNTGDREGTDRGQGGDRGTTERGWGTDTGRETQSGQMTNRTPRDTSLMNHFNHQGGLKDQAGNRWIAGSNPCPCRQQCVEQTPETSASLSTFRVHCPPASH